MRVAPDAGLRDSKGVATIGLGVAISGVVSAPLGSALSEQIGWWATVLALLTERTSRRGMTAIFLLFAGSLGLYTDFRPWMESPVGLADRAEITGGLQVATIQLAIMAGSATGGAVFDDLGWTTCFAFDALLLFAAGLAGLATPRSQMAVDPIA